MSESWSPAWQTGATTEEEISTTPAQEYQNPRISLISKQNDRSCNFLPFTIAVVVVKVESSLLPHNLHPGSQGEGNSLLVTSTFRTNDHFQSHITWQASKHCVSQGSSLMIHGCNVVMFQQSLLSKFDCSES